MDSRLILVPAIHIRAQSLEAPGLSYVSVNSDVPYEVVAYVGSDHVISIQREMYERLKVIDD